MHLPLRHFVVLLLAFLPLHPAAAQDAAKPATQPAALPDPAESIGSTRNARVAYPIPPGERPQLTVLLGELSPQQLAEVRTLAPNLNILSGLSREEALAQAEQVHAIDGRFASPDFLARAKNLCWVQAMSAGVDRYLGNEPIMSNDKVVLTNMRAVHGPAIADHAFAMLLTLTRTMPRHAANQAKGAWDDSESTGPSPIALHGRTMLVVGLGGIGSEIAQRAHGFGMRVLATRRSDAEKPAYVERVGKSADLLAMLPEADVVAVCVPLTSETEGLFNAAAFAAMKPHSYLINIARGKIVETDALMAALDSGRLAGACLDVTDPEPLPADHPLWKKPNVIITPHVAAEAELTSERHWTLLRENLRRFAAGEPLLNVVDKKAGY